MNDVKSEVIKYIETKKAERIHELQGLQMSVLEQDMQHSILLGVDMVIRWLNEMDE